MRVECLSKSCLLRYERGSLLLFARNAYATQEALSIQWYYEARPAVQLAQRTPSNRGKLIYPDRPPLLYLWAKSGMQRPI
jgi:hypothetical protein